MFYCVDKLTGKRTSLQTTNKDEAHQIGDAGQELRGAGDLAGDSEPTAAWR